MQKILSKMDVAKLLVVGTVVAMACALACVMPAQAHASMTQTAQTGNSVTVSWDASTQKGLLNYQVRIAADYDSVKVAAPLDVQKNTSYTFTNLAPGTRYYVKVEYNYNSGKNTYRDCFCGSGEIKTLPTKVTGVRQEKWWYFIKSVDGTWDKQSGADGYEWNFKKNSGEAVKSGTNTYGSSLRASTSVSNNHVYKLQVRAYADINGQRYFGDWSDAAYMFTQPMVKKAKVTSKKQLQLTWGKVNGTDKYDIYLSTKEKSGYKKVKTVKSKTTKATIKKLKGKKFNKKKTYYVYIVAKKKVGGVTYDSGRHYTAKLKGSSAPYVRWTF